MQLVEQHCISKSDPRYAIIDAAAFKSKNLYNAALYEMRQAFIHEGKYLNYTEMDKRMQSSDAYKALTVSSNRLNQTKNAVSIDVHVFWNYDRVCEMSRCSQQVMSRKRYGR